MIKLYYIDKNLAALPLPDVDPNTYKTLLQDYTDRLLSSGVVLPVDFKFEFNVLLNKNPTEGNLAYVFKPFKNVRYSGKNEIISGILPNELVDFTTKDLNYSINYPVDIEIQPSYDGTVNLILSDNNTPPRLVNSRFSVTEGRRFYIVDREGNKDTNIYDDDRIDSQSRLYKTINRIPKLELVGLDNGGRLRVGNYVFYFRLVDADGNETDIITESGIVSCHVGNLNDPQSIRGGMGHENSGKSVTFRLTNLDSNYNFLNVYYSLSTSDYTEKEITEFVKIETKFSIKSTTIDLTITGYEAISPITKDKINIQYNIIDRNKTTAIAQNRLFLANIHKTTVPYRELKDLSLRVLPFPQQDSTKNIGVLSNNFISDDKKVAYFDSNNVYSFTGFWDEEIYRLAIVYIMNDFALSDPYSIRGKDFTGSPVGTLNENPHLNMYTEQDLYDDNKNRVFIQEEDNLIVGSAFKLENTKGVIKIGGESIKSQIGTSSTIPISFRIVIPNDVQVELKKYTKGFFIVRQKRIPTILCQAFSIGHDKMSGLPLLPEWNNGKLVHTIQGIHIYKPQYGTTYANTPYGSINGALNDTAYYRLPSKGESYFSFVNDAFPELTNFKTNVNSGGALLVPDVLLNSEYLVQLFSGSDFVLTGANFKTKVPGFTREFSAENLPPSKTMEELDDIATHFTLNQYEHNSTYFSQKVKLVLVPEDVASTSLDSTFFSTRAGIAEEPWHFSAFLKKELELVDSEEPVIIDGLPQSKKQNSMIRGMFAPFVGVVGNIGTSGNFYNIRVLGYSEANIADYFGIRYNDNSPFMAISDRYDWERFDTEQSSPIKSYKSLDVYRGDCFINQVSIRMLRNFQDPETPINDIIVDTNTLENFKGYGTKDTETLELNKENLEKINRGDVNAVRLGYWATFKFCSDINFAFRCVDPTYTSEYALAGRPRSFVPLYSRSLAGSAKIADSGTMNVGYNSTTSDKEYFVIPDIPAIKNDFTNRVMYSETHINDAFKNGYRIFEGINYQDYTVEFGTITKVISWMGNLVVVFEAGVGLLPINERTLAGQSEGENVFLRNAGVLPEKPLVISHGIGSTWADSIRVTKNYVYGVDTVAKKIWRTDGKKFDTISDFRVQKFLNDNISFTVYDKTPMIGLRNVVTHYNVFKNDIIFTFYDQTFNEPDRVWSLCYNEQLNNWVTRYSWMPAFSENISNTFFTFARGTCKVTSMISKSIDSTDGLGNIYINSKQENYLTEGDYLSLFYEGSLEELLPTATPTSVLGDALSAPYLVPTATPVLFSDSNTTHRMYEVGAPTQGYTHIWNFYPTTNRVLVVYDKDNASVALSSNSRLDFYRSANNDNSISGGDEFIMSRVNGDIVTDMQTTITKPNLKVKFTVGAVASKTIADSMARDGWEFSIANVDYASSLLDTREYFLTLQGKESYSKTAKFRYTRSLLADTTVYDNQFFKITENSVDGSASYISVNPTALATLSLSDKFKAILQFFSRIYFAFLVDLDVVLGDDLGKLSGTDKFQDSLYVRPSITALNNLRNQVFNNLSNCPPLHVGTNIDNPTVYLTESQRQQIADVLDVTIARYIANTTTNLWKHGQSGIFEHEDAFKPALWYGEQHKFELEFVVNGDELGIHKLFDNLKIISNKAEPESFSFEIVGDTYEFTDDFPAYSDQGLIGGKIKDTYELLLPAKQTIYEKTKEYRILSFQPAQDIQRVGQRKGNIRYKEDMWEVQIQPLRVKKKSSGQITETKIRDKYCKIRVVYSGTQLAIITALQTLYTLSYS